MGRLVIVLLALACLAGVAYLALRVVSHSRETVARAEFGGRSVQKVSFMLLLALILYAAIWGAA